MPVWKSRPMAGRAMLTTVASSAAIPEPSTVIASTQRPGAEEYERAGASAVVMSRQLRSLSWGTSSIRARGAGRPGGYPLRLARGGPWCLGRLEGGGEQVAGGQAAVGPPFLGDG